MQRGAIALAVMSTLVVSGLASCKDKNKSAPSPSAGPGSEAGPAGPTTHARAKPPGPPPPTAPDATYEERRRLLLVRGNPEMMKDAPIAQTTAPDVNAKDLLKPIGKDLWQVGRIKVDLAKGRAELPAKVAASAEMPLEYIAVAPSGKAYESLLTIDTSSIELRLALSLLGYEGTMPDKEGTAPAATAEDSVMLAAIVGGKERPISAYMIDKKSKKPPKDVPWQVLGFQPDRRDQALLTKDFFTLVARDVFAPVRYSIDPGNSYAGPNEGYTGNAKLLPKDAAVTFVVKRNPAKPAPPPMPDMNDLTSIPLPAPTAPTTTTPPSPSPSPSPSPR
jgi:hypothetical protein